MAWPLNGDPAKSLGLIAHPGPVVGMNLSHDGCKLVTAGHNDGSVMVWQVLAYTSFGWQPQQNMPVSSAGLVIHLSAAHAVQLVIQLCFACPVFRQPQCMTDAVFNTFAAVLCQYFKSFSKDAYYHVLSQQPYAPKPPYPASNLSSHPALPLPLCPGRDPQTLLQVVGEQLRSPRIAMSAGKQWALSPIPGITYKILTATST